MFNVCTHQYNKDVILKGFSVCGGVVHVTFDTIALGIHLKDVNTVIQNGDPQSHEVYFQESGRGERSGGDAVSTVFWKPVECPVRKQPMTLRDHEPIAGGRYVENVTVCQ